MKGMCCIIPTKLRSISTKLRRIPTKLEVIPTKLGQRTGKSKEQNS